MSNFASGDLWIYNATTLAVEKKITLGGNPALMEILPGLDTVFVVVRGTDRIGVIQGLTTLRADAGEDSRELEVANPETLAPGQRLHLREAEACVGGRVGEGAGSPVGLREPRAMGCRAGAKGADLESGEVLGAEEAGSGHHLRVALRRRV